MRRSNVIGVVTLACLLVSLASAACSSPTQTSSAAQTAASPVTPPSSTAVASPDPLDPAITSTDATAAVTAGATSSSTTTAAAGPGLFPARGPASKEHEPLWGYIDRNGDFAIAPQFVNADSFSEGLAAVERKDHVHGYVDARGEFVLQIQYESAGAYSFSDGVAPATDDHYKAGYIDKQGEWVIPPRFDATYDFSEGLAPVLVDGLFGYIDHTGSVVIPPRFLFALSFSEGLAAAAIKVPGNGQETAPTKWGYIDKTGEFVIAPQFLYMNLNSVRCLPGDFHEGLADVLVEGLQRSFIDRTGQVVLGPYGGAFAFSDGLAPVATQDGRSWGYIDKTGEFAIPPQFQEAHPFEDGLASVVIPTWVDAYTDKTGQIVWRWK